MDVEQLTKIQGAVGALVKLCQAHYVHVQQHFLPKACQVSFAGGFFYSRASDAALEAGGDVLRT